MIRECAYCGVEFTPRQGRGRPRKYCTSTCRLAMDKEKFSPLRTERAKRRRMAHI